MLQRKEKCCWENYSSVAAAIWCSMPHLTGQTQSSLVGSPADCLTQPAPAPLNVYPTGLPCPKAPSSGKGACCTRLKSNPTRLERGPTSNPIFNQRKMTGGKFHPASLSLRGLFLRHDPCSFLVGLCCDGVPGACSSHEYILSVFLSTLTLGPHPYPAFLNCRHTKLWLRAPFAEEPRLRLFAPEGCLQPYACERLKHAHPGYLNVFPVHWQ